MKYVIDTNILIDMKHFYPLVFQSLWYKMNELIAANEMISVREAYHELTTRDDFISKWVKENDSIFVIPSAEEYTIIEEIMTKHKELVKNESINGGKAVADPFLIAKAKANKSILLTNEKFIKNAHKIPNVCKEYEITVMNLKEFMMNEKWQF